MKAMLSKQRGMTLTELLVAMGMGVIVMGALVQVIVTNEMAGKLNSAMETVNDGGRLIMGGLSESLRHTGRSDLINGTINSDVDIIEESAFIRRNAVVSPGDFPASASLGSTEGSLDENDELVVGMRAARDCSGNQHGYAGQDFYVVNHFSVNAAGELVCRGYNGRALRGQTSGTESTVVLARNVDSFQVLYGIAEQGRWGPSAVEQYIDANGIVNARNQGQVVSSIKVAVLLNNGSNVNVTNAQQFQLLDEAPLSLPVGPYRKQFSFEVYLRNLANQSGVL